MRAPLTLISDLSGGHDNCRRAFGAKENCRSGQIWSGWIVLGTALCIAIGCGFQALTILP
jgi:hypothetical protein